MPRFREKSRIVEAWQLASTSTSARHIINALKGFATWGPNDCIYITIDGQQQLMTPDDFVVRYLDTGELRILTPGEFTFEFEHAL